MWGVDVVHKGLQAGFTIMDPCQGLVCRFVNLVVQLAKDCGPVGELGGWVECKTGCTMSAYQALLLSVILLIVYFNVRMYINCCIV